MLLRWEIRLEDEFAGTAPSAKMVEKPYSGETRKTLP